MTRHPHPTRPLPARHAALLVLMPALVSLHAAIAQPVPLPRAHAHNDYEHERPLRDALERGFGSVEADIHLVDGALLVAHDRADTQPGRTLQALYLDPLRAHIRANDGRVYAGAPPLLLLIDVKTDAAATYAVLGGVLGSYADILTRFSQDGIQQGAVTAVISGNRDRAAMAAEPVRFAAYDGRLEDLALDPPPPPSLIPLVSSHWARIARWQGRGTLPEASRRALQRVVNQAHAQGRKIRFWATADDPAVWRVLYEAGVDLLGTDDLDALQAFLLAPR